MLPCSHSTFSSIIRQGRSHNLSEGLHQDWKVHPGSSGPPGRWTTWEEYLQLKPGKFTSDQIAAVITQNQLKIDRSMTRILKMFDWYSTLRLVAVVGCFECQVGADNSGERWRQALLGFSYHNVCFDLKQLIEVLHCDLQVTRIGRSPGGHPQSNCKLYQPLSHQNDNSVCSLSACFA